MNSRLKIKGYDLLDNGKDGIRFAWNYAGSTYFVESAAFPQRRVGVEDGICGYTTSVSLGCILRIMGLQCKFCRTGNLLPFSGTLSYKDIAKQNVFMVLADIYCDDSSELHDRPREFAYMGQGEPGYAYPQVRLAIELTNRVMKNINQKVHRHIFATCGIPEAIWAYKSDLKNFFTEKVTLHYSLHGTNGREQIMPVDTIYSYQECLEVMEDIYDISGEKPCIGILLFSDFKALKSKSGYSNDLNSIREILTKIDAQKFRLSFCDFNPSHEIGSSKKYLNQNALDVLEYAREMGFEAKLFYSYGQSEKTACGMLGSTVPSKLAKKKWIELEKYAEELIEKNI